MAEYFLNNDIFFFPPSYSMEMDIMEYCFPSKEMNSQSNNNNSTISEVDDGEQQCKSLPKLSSNNHRKLFKTIAVLPKYKSSAKAVKSKYENGRWKKVECLLFMKGLLLYGIQWQKLKHLISTRSVEQIRSHAQKVFGVLHKVIHHKNNIHKVNRDIHKYFTRVLGEDIRPKGDFYRIMRDSICKTDQLKVTG